MRSSSSNLLGTRHKYLMRASVLSMAGPLGFWSVIQNALADGD